MQSVVLWMFAGSLSIFGFGGFQCVLAQTSLSCPYLEYIELLGKCIIYICFIHMYKSNLETLRLLYIHIFVLSHFLPLCDLYVGVFNI